MDQQPITPTTPNTEHASMLQKELLSLLVLILLGTGVVLGVLLVNSNRQISQMSKAVSVTPVPMATKVAVLPIARTYNQTIALPTPKLKSNFSVEQALEARRSRRTFTDAPLSISQLSQILWSAQGVTDTVDKLRTAPSAYNVYPFTVYALVRNVTGLKPGLYEYLPDTHALGDMKLANASDLLNASGVEAMAQKTPVVLLLSAAMDKGLDKLKGGAQSSAYLEGGHIGENIYLQVESLKLSTVVTGGVGSAAKALKLDPTETLVYVIPVGNRVPEN